MRHGRSAPRRRCGPWQAGGEDGASRVVAPATPMTMPATETIPSLAPSTPARSQIKRPALLLPECGSRECVGRPLRAALELSGGGRQVVVAHRSYSPWLKGIAPRTSFVFGSTTLRYSNAGPRPASGFSDRAIGAACYGKSAASRRLSVGRGARRWDPDPGRRRHGARRNTALTRE